MLLCAFQAPVISNREAPSRLLFPWTTPGVSLQNLPDYLNFLISPLWIRAKYEFISRLTIGARK